MERFLIVMADGPVFDSSDMKRLIARMADQRNAVLGHLQRAGYKAPQAAYVEALIHAHLCAGSLPGPAGAPSRAMPGNTDDSYSPLGWVA